MKQDKAFSVPVAPKNLHEVQFFFSNSLIFPVLVEKAK